ncbi:MAG: transposase [Clostridia bacterium]|nr:transposase [Clostridia bacterium]
MDITFPNANRLFNSPTRADGSEKWVDFVADFCHPLAGLIDKAIAIRDAARASVGSDMPAKSLELKPTIQLIRKIEDESFAILDTIQSPIVTIPGMRKRMGAMILAEIGDFSFFDSPDKLVAYADLSPAPTSPAGSMLPALMPTWRSEARVIFGTPSLMSRNTFAHGNRRLSPALTESEPRESITTSRSLMHPRSS